MMTNDLSRRPPPLYKPDYLCKEFQHWALCYLMERNVTPDAESYALVVNVILQGLLQSHAGNCFMLDRLEEQFGECCPR